MPDYIVQKGNTLSGIAAKLHTTWQALFRRNRGVIGNNPNAIQPGMKLAYGPLPTHAAPHPPAVTKPPARKPPAPKVNRIVANALNKALHTVVCPEGECDHECAAYYGLGSSGYNSAYINAQNVPVRYRHTLSRGKAGMVAFWTGGSHHYGHAALYLGNGYIRCTDMDAHGNYTPGVVSTIPLAWVSERWGLTFMYLTDPYFQGRLITTV